MWSKRSGESGVKKEIVNCVVREMVIVAKSLNMKRKS